MFRNTNSVQAPIFAPAVKIQAGGVDLLLNHKPGGGSDGSPRSVVRVLDWDGDGLKDLVCSSDTGVYWCRNTKDNSNPILQAPVVIYAAPVTGSGLTNIVTGPVPGVRMRIYPVDWSDDGVMDMLVGDYSGKVYYFEGSRFEVTQNAPQSGGGLVLQWNSASNLNYYVLTNGCFASAWSLAVSNLPSGGNSTSCKKTFNEIFNDRVRTA